MRHIRKHDTRAVDRISARKHDAISPVRHVGRTIAAVAHGPGEIKGVTGSRGSRHGNGSDGEVGSSGRNRDWSDTGIVEACVRLKYGETAIDDNTDHITAAQLRRQHQRHVLRILTAARKSTGVLEAAKYDISSIARRAAKNDLIGPAIDRGADPAGI